MGFAIGIAILHFGTIIGIDFLDPDTDSDAGSDIYHRNCKDGCFVPSPFLIKLRPASSGLSRGFAHFSVHEN